MSSGLWEIFKNPDKRSVSSRLGGGRVPLPRELDFERVIALAGNNPQLAIGARVAPNSISILSGRLVMASTDSSKVVTSLPIAPMPDLNAASVRLAISSSTPTSDNPVSEPVPPKEFVARPGIRLSFASTLYLLRCAMIETGLVYIYSVSPARPFKGCGALLEGGYIATCRHVWRIAAPAGQPPEVEPEVEIEFPFGTKEKVGGGDKYVAPARRARLADACVVLDGTAPDLVFLTLVEPRSQPSGVMWLQPAAHDRFETGAGFAHAGLIGRDKANPSRVSDVRVKGEIIDFIDSERAPSVYRK
jgi:hypothetical protein